MYTKIIIPKLSNSYKLYIYCSKNPENINTISKIKTIYPTIVIDESIASTQIINDKECYVVFDNPEITQAGVTYHGPKLNILPTTEYETNIDIVNINNYTHLNVLCLNDLDIKYNGTMLYYSVIGVDEENNMITHISKVNGILMETDFKTNGTRHIYSCDNYTGEINDVWKYIGSCTWNENIRIGDKTNIVEYEKYGIPFIETVPIFKEEDISTSIKSLSLNNYLTLEIPNPWYKNNSEFRLRKLKSFKIQNVYQEQYSDFSEPSYQSELPVSIEKMIILYDIDSSNPNEPIPIEEIYKENSTIKFYEIIRRDGIYYNVSEHRKYSLNKYIISINDNVAIYSETSPQNKLNVQIEATPAHLFRITIYLYDVYGKISEPLNITVNT